MLSHMLEVLCLRTQWSQGDVISLMSLILSIARGVSTNLHHFYPSVTAALVSPQHVQRRMWNLVWLFMAPPSVQHFQVYKRNLTGRLTWNLLCMFLLCRMNPVIFILLHYRHFTSATHGTKFCSQSDGPLVDCSDLHPASASGQNVGYGLEYLK